MTVKHYIEIFHPIRKKEKKKKKRIKERGQKGYLGA